MVALPLFVEFYFSSVLNISYFFLTLLLPSSPYLPCGRSIRCTVNSYIAFSMFLHFSNLLLIIFITLSHSLIISLALSSSSLIVFQLFDLLFGLYIKFLTSTLILFYKLNLVLFLTCLVLF